MDLLSAMRTFVRVVELGSFARAADRLDRSTSAVSRQVAELEAHLDARLLNRTTRRLSLTEAGQSFHERATQIVADLEEAEASLRSGAAEPRGTLRLTCGVTFGVRYLAPALSELAALYPRLVFDLDLSDRVVDLVEEGFDLGVRIGPLVQQGLVSRRLGSTRLVCCAAPAYLERHRDLPLAVPEDLVRHECLSYTQVPVPNVWRFEDPAGGKFDVRFPTRHRVNNGRMLVALAADGLGVVYEPDFIVAPEIQSGRLVRLLPQFRPSQSPISAVYPSRRHLSAKVRAVVAFLADRFSRRQDWSLPD